MVSTATSLELPLAPATTVAGEQENLYTGLRPVRTLAMLTIVAYHITWQPLFGVVFGVTALQVVMCALATREETVRSIRSVIRRRGKRLLWPWLVWCAIYGLLEIALAVQSGEAPLAGFDRSMWLSGTSFHLWFLPFAFLASLAANRIAKLLESTPRELTIAALASLGAAIVIAIPLAYRLGHPPHPYSLWLDGAGTIVFGVAIGRVLSMRSAHGRLGWLLFIAGTAAATVHVGPEVADDSPLYARYGVAVPLACLGFIIRLPEVKWLAWLASCNLGIYVMHMLALRTLGRIPAMAEQPTAVWFVLTYLLCLGAVVGVRKLRIPGVF